MKIVKSFEDFEFLDKVMEGPNDPATDKWLWGLGEDGNIYYHHSNSSFPDWRLLKRDNFFSCQVSLKTMKKLVNEFGHLLPFI